MDRFKRVVVHSRARNGLGTSTAGVYVPAGQRSARERPQDLHQYTAYVEDHRRLDNGALAKRVTSLVHGPPGVAELEGLLAAIAEISIMIDDASFHRTRKS